jgi:hypothetical protein
LVFLPHGPEQHTFTLPSSEKQGLLRPGVALQVGSLLLGKVEDSVDKPPPETLSPTMRSGSLG